jgi:hypothetical protein
VPDTSPILETVPQARGFSRSYSRGSTPDSYGGARGSGREVQPRGTDDVLLGEVARTLGVARSTAWARVLRGIIPAEWRGGRYLVRREDLIRLVEEAERSRAE